MAITAEQANLDASIVVITYQSAGYVGACLRSIQAHADLPTETIVVDNDSSDATLDEASAAHPAATIVPLEVNTGFAAASNVGAAQARGRYILFLNPDAELIDGTLPRMADYLDANPHVAAVGPRLVYGDGSPQDNAFAYPSLLMTWLEFFPRPGRLLGTRLNGRLQSRDGGPISITHPLGACMLVRREAWADVGPFDRGFFLYCEEVDWCVRARERGWDIVHLPAATAIHHGGRSAAAAPAASLTHLYASRTRLHRKHRSWKFQAANLLITLLGLAHQRAHLRRQLRNSTPPDPALAARLRAIDHILERAR